MVENEDVLLALPEEDSFIYQYVRYASHITDAPMGYHLFSILPVLSVFCDPDVQTHLGGAGTFWTLLVGASGHSRKTTAANKAMKMLQAVAPDLIGSAHESTASLLEAVADQQQQLIYHGEFGVFLAGTGKNSYKAGLREGYMEMWDGTPISKTSKGKGEMKIPSPRLSLLACVAPPLLEQHTGEHDWTGGFFSRWVACYCVRREHKSFPPSWPTQEQYLIKHLKGIAAQNIGEFGGLSPAAQAFYIAWDHACMATYQDHTNKWTEGAASRLSSVVLKASIIFSHDNGAAAHSNGRAWQLTERDVRLGVGIANMHMKSLMTLVGSLAMSPYGRERRSVLRAVGDDGVYRPFGEILRRCQPKLPMRKVKGTLDALIAETTIHQTALNGAVFYAAGVPAPTATSDWGNLDIKTVAETPDEVAPAPEQAPAATPANYDFFGVGTAEA